MDPLLFTTPAKIRVLLVPVHPIKAQVFHKHVELVRKFNVVKLGDVTPDMRSVQSMFSSQLFHEGQLHFNFVTSYEPEHSYLEEFQMHRRIFGVIGIMDCREWQSLPDGYKKFCEILKNYPTAIAHRCFAFDPFDHQPDDTKGLIMFPDVGNMTFYMTTMISDFANNILTEFGTLASAIESKNVIHSPKIPTENSNPSQNGNSTVNGHGKFSSPSHSFSSPELNVPTIPSLLTLTPPSQAMTTAGMGGTSVGANPSNPFHGRSFSSSNLVSFATQAANATSTVTDMKLKRRSQGRIQKLIADLYLMAGRLPDAVSNYSLAIDTTKANGDYLWHGSALEGLCVGLILSAYLHSDVGSHLIQSPPSPSQTAPTIPPTPNASPATGAPPVTEPPKDLWAHITDKYVTVLTLYAKTSSSNNNQVPPLIYAEACLKVAKMLSCIWVVGGWGDEALRLIVHGGVPEPQLSEKWGLSIVSGISKIEITQWAVKGYGSYVEDMSITEQIYIATNLSAIFSIINFRRKHAFFLRQTSLLILPLLKQRIGAPNKSPFTNEAGLLICLKKVAEVFGVGDSIDHVDYSNVVEDARPLSFGWPDIQIDVLKDAISVTEALPDYNSMMKYTTRLLRKLFMYLSRDEQLRLSGLLPRIVSAGKKQGLPMEFKYWGLNIVKGIQVCQPTTRRIPYPHPGKKRLPKNEDLESKDNSSPFIYQSFNKKKEEAVQTHLVANETAYFLVTLANPFAFDLEIQSITVSTDGVAFKPNPMSTTVTANTSVTLRVSGTPTEPGDLVVRGCKVKVHGCLEQEFCVYLPRNEEETRKKEREEEHKKSKASTVDGVDLLADFLKVVVIMEQPLVKIKSTSLMHGAVMLFEGEKTEMTMKLENVGKTPVDYISISFHDSTIADAQAILNSSDIPAEEAYEMELYAHKQPVFFWEQTDKELNISPGNEWVLNLNVFGKRGCTNGTIQIDYGYLNRLNSSCDEVFYTRQVYYQVLLTIHQNLESVSMDILSFKPLNIPPIDSSKNLMISSPSNSNDQIVNGTITTSVASGEDQRNKRVEELIKNIKWKNVAVDNFLERMENEYCLLTFDIRNVWHTAFDVTIDSENLSVSTTVQPAATGRIVIPIKKILLSEKEFTQQIPSLFEKQFVVSKGPKNSVEQEKLQLALFWYREKLLQKLLTNQRGTVDIRSLRLNKSMLNVLKINEISYGIDIVNSSKVIKLSPSQIQPVQSYTDGVMEWDLSRRMVWNGLLQTPLPKIEPKSSVVFSLPICFFSRGDFKFLYHCEDVHTRATYFDSQPLYVEVIDE
nr:7314_t:CDS:10 [Entrophospora candida]CAG8549502.1 2812_t:CDS:10 [Entrophospora candida]